MDRIIVWKLEEKIDRDLNGIFKDLIKEQKLLCCVKIDRQLKRMCEMSQIDGEI